MSRSDAVAVASELAWFKSSYSGGNDGESCVELASTPGTVHVRDSKTLEGPRLALAPGAWTHFVAFASGS
ncbi:MULTISPECIES: DUF397 domain-containing protein [Streptomyces]|uniref:DUF397 domain-containing protein n=1 Tax=Streptomyces edwardsiae TaxID=3075527 RepID=A0ABU2PYZ1_9ACTN|nr:DUF397 domain-containing protein [Streptomyces sp. DSM 41636]MDT0397382.1 DUF397 domain-containing protein [Streptomyces sp. DSM 41636]